MISRLVIKNFKSIGKQGLDIELKPLTILLGPNGSGKSSIIESLLVLKTKAKTQFDISNPEGMKEIKTDSMLDLVHKKDNNEWLDIRVDITPHETNLRDLRSYFENAKNELEKILSEIKMEKIDNIGYAFSWKAARKESKSSVFLNNIKVMVSSHSFDKNSKKNKDVFEYPQNFKDIPTEVPASYVLEPRVFRPTTKGWRTNYLVIFAEEIVTQISSFINQKMFFVSALRGDIPYVGEGTNPPKWVGIKGEYSIHILSLLNQRRFKKKKEKIQKWANQFGLEDVSGTWESYNKLTSDYADPAFGTALNSALASHGSKQILPVIIQLFWSDPDNLIMIEEPEISLHPDSQVLLPEMFAEAVNDRKQIIVTTHSELLMIGLGTHIRNGLIKPEDVAVYHITKDSKGSHATRLKITSKGYVKGWIPSFAELENKLLQEWIQTVPEEE